jgi:MSHA biogenesis protein MshJ
MKKYWQRYVAWFGKLKPREQQIIALAVFIGLPFLGYTYAVEPSLLKAARSAKAAQDASASLAALDQQATMLQNLNRDPDAPLRKDMEQLKTQLGAQNSRFQAVEKSLVSPAQMPVLLESLLAKSRTTQLLSLRSLPATPLIERKAVDAKTATDAAKAAANVAAASPANAPNLFKHGYEIKVRGSYADLMTYLTELENSPQRLIWGRMDMETDYPQSTLTLKVYTLSLDKQWLTL